MRLEIPDFLGYLATKDGRVWSNPKEKGHHKGKFLKSKQNCRGYLYVILYKGGKKYTRTVHRLILEAFIGPRPEGMECCHGNGIRTDNRLENLRWDTRGENHKDAFKHGTMNHQGENSPVAKLNNMKVRVIRRMLGHGYFLQREIAEIFGVTPTTVSDIKNKKSWDYI